MTELPYRRKRLERHSAQRQPSGGDSAADAHERFAHGKDLLTQHRGQPNARDRIHESPLSGERLCGTFPTALSVRTASRHKGARSPNASGAFVISLPLRIRVSLLS